MSEHTWVWLTHQGVDGVGSLNHHFEDVALDVSSSVYLLLDKANRVSTKLVEIHEVYQDFKGDFVIHPVGFWHDLYGLYMLDVDRRERRANMEGLELRVCSVDVSTT